MSCVIALLRFFQSRLLFLRPYPNGERRPLRVGRAFLRRRAQPEQNMHGEEKELVANFMSSIGNRNRARKEPELSASANNRGNQFSISSMGQAQSALVQAANPQIELTRICCSVQAAFPSSGEDETSRFTGDITKALVFDLWEKRFRALVKTLDVSAGMQVDFFGRSYMW